MKQLHGPGAAVVVGIDGSTAAVDAALWAVEEAVHRDIPLRLLYAVESAPDTAGDPQYAAHDLATAEVAVRYALTAVESTERPVKIEVEILQTKPARALVEASRSAALVCVGAVGQSHALPGGVGSTTTALVKTAHCPVAVVRPARWPQRVGRIVVEVDDTSDSDNALEWGLTEARLRGAPLYVLQAWQSHFTDVHDSAAAADNNRMVRSQLERRLARWRRCYPEVDVHAVAVQGSTLGYLAKNARAIQLVVVAAQRTGGAAEFVGPSGLAALRDTSCSVLVCDGHRNL